MSVVTVACARGEKTGSTYEERRGSQIEKREAIFHPYIAHASDTVDTRTSGNENRHLPRPLVKDGPECCRHWNPSVRRSGDPLAEHPYPRLFLNQNAHNLPLYHRPLATASNPVQHPRRRSR